MKPRDIHPWSNEQISLTRRIPCCIDSVIIVTTPGKLLYLYRQKEL